MFDAHAHLQDARLAAVLDDVVRRAEALSGVCCCGTSPEDWAALERLAGGVLPFALVPAFGVHPWWAGGLPAEWVGQLEDALARHPGAAVGEVGLDGVRDTVPAAAQEAVLTAQLELAARLGRPVVLHGARAWERLAEVLAPFSGRLPAFVLHGFGGSSEALRRLLALGGRVSFAGTVCAPRAARARAAAAAVPEDRLLVETDSPDLFPVGGLPAGGALAAGAPLNQPANLSLVLEEVARLRACPAEALADLTERNARQAFGLAACPGRVGFTLGDGEEAV